MTAMALTLLQLPLFLAGAPLLLGVIGRVKAVAAGRTGPPLLQPYRDLARLAGKGAVFSRTATWVFRAGPAVALGATLTAGLLVPMGAPEAALRFTGDFILFAYLLEIGRAHV